MENKSIIVITGPSGVGKTTLGNKITSNSDVLIPFHCTTRLKRNDDIEGFYKYFTYEQFKEHYDNKNFLIASGDSPIIKKGNGNFYGVLKDDCYKSWEKSNIIILFASYKDIYSLIDLMEKGIDIGIINLKFKNIEKGIESRILNDTSRKQTNIDILNRIKQGLIDSKTYGNIVDKYSKSIIYTDILDEECTYEKACYDLKIKRRKNI